MAAIPTVTLSVPAERDYMTIMERTKMVYDQLLRDKNAKLVEALVVKKQVRSFSIWLIELMSFLFCNYKEKGYPRFTILGFRFIVTQAPCQTDLS